jgi:hypothetical protein
VDGCGCEEGNPKNYVYIHNYLWVPHVIGAHGRGVSDARGVVGCVLVCVFKLSNGA